MAAMLQRLTAQQQWDQEKAQQALPQVLEGARGAEAVRFFEKAKAKAQLTVLVAATAAIGLVMRGSHEAFERIALCTSQPAGAATAMTTAEGAEKRAAGETAAAAQPAGQVANSAQPTTEGAAQAELGAAAASEAGGAREAAAAGVQVALLQAQCRNASEAVWEVVGALPTLAALLSAACAACDPWHVFRQKVMEHWAAATSHTGEPGGGQQAACCRARVPP